MKELSHPLAKLDESLSPLEAFFADTADTPRFIALLSPTCPGCIDGADTVREAILEEHDTELAVAIGWIPMLDGDTQDEIEQAS